MNKDVRRFINDIGEYHDYNNAEPIDVVALRALKDRMLESRENRADGGILTDAYSWDFMPRDAQSRAIRRLFYSIGHAWGFDRSDSIKLTAATCLINISPFVKDTVAKMYEKNTSGLFYVHGLYSYL